MSEQVFPRVTLMSEQKQKTTPEFDRRSLLKLGFFGTMLFSGAALLGHHPQASASSEASTKSPGHFDFLLEHEVKILSVVAPVVIADNFPAEAARRSLAFQQMMRDIDHFMLSTSAQTQEQIHGLFKLLDLSVFRSLAGGLWSDWEEASESDIRTFLHRWRDSRFNTFRQGYVALIQLPTLAFYSEPSNWTARIYPGPPEHKPT